MLHPHSSSSSTHKFINFDELNRRAQSAISTGDFSAAAFWFRRILEHKPRNAEVMASLGQALCWQRRRKEGLYWLNKSADILCRKNPRKLVPLQHLLGLSGLLQHWGEIESALKLAKLAIRNHPTSAEAHFNVARCLARINKVKDAINPAVTASKLLPDEPSCELILAHLEMELGDLDSSLARLTRITQGTAINEHTSRAWLESGVVLDKMERYAESYQAFSRSAELNRTLPATGRVDKNSIFNTLSVNLAGFTPSLLRKWEGYFSEDELDDPVFLMGFLRSGTTLTEKVLATHPMIVESDENEFIFEVSRELSRLTGIENNTPAALERIDIDQACFLRNFYWTRVMEEFGDQVTGKVFIDKLSLNSIDIGLIATLFPDSKIIFALRDPRDVLISCFQQPFNITPATVNLLSLDGICQQYTAVMDLWLSVRPNLAPKYIELKYEDSINFFSATFTKLFEFLNLEWRDDSMRFHEHVNGRYVSTPSFTSVSKPLYRSSLQRWKNYQPYMHESFYKLRKYLDIFNYSASQI